MPENTGSDNIEIVTVSNAAVPSRCIWAINLATGGGCLVRSTYNSKYLFSTGGYLYTSSTTGTYGTSTYSSRVWRIISISTYGNTSSHTSRELEDFVITPMVLKVGEPETPDIFPIPTTANWAGAYNFIYTGYDTTKISYDSVTGTFTAASSLTAPYTATVTAIHKVTGYTATFSVLANPGAVLIGVEDLRFGYDHDTNLENCEESIQTCGYEYDYRYGSFTPSQIDQALADQSNKVFVIACHGNILRSASDEAIGSLLYLNENDRTVQYTSNGSMNILDLSHLDLVIFNSCRSAHGGENAVNLPSVAVARGAKTAIGFKEDVAIPEGNRWTEVFFEQLALGKTVEEADVIAQDTVKREMYGFDDDEYSAYNLCGLGSCTIFGDKNTKIK